MYSTEKSLKVKNSLGLHWFKFLTEVFFLKNVDWYEESLIVLLKTENIRSILCSVNKSRSIFFSKKGNNNSNDDDAAESAKLTS